MKIVRPGRVRPSDPKKQRMGGVCSYCGCVIECERQETDEDECVRCPMPGCGK